MSGILNIYRERCGDPGFWAEPINALTNVSFLIAAVLAWRLAVRRQAATPATVTLIVLAGAVGVGSFVFHTAAGPVTLWLDVIPIAMFQVMFLWLAYHRILRLSKLWSSAIVALVLGTSFALMPIHQPLNGSLFYVPSWVAVVVLGGATAVDNRFKEPYLLLIAAASFTCAIVARSSDWEVTWKIGSHFLWHVINGLVVYLGLRSWIVEVVGRTGNESL